MKNIRLGYVKKGIIFSALGMILDDFALPEYKLKILNDALCIKKNGIDFVFTNGHDILKVDGITFKKESSFPADNVETLKSFFSIFKNSKLCLINQDNQKDKIIFDFQPNNPSKKQKELISVTYYENTYHLFKESKTGAAKFELNSEVLDEHLINILIGVLAFYWINLENITRL